MQESKTLISWKNWDKEPKQAFDLKITWDFLENYPPNPFFVVVFVVFFSIVQSIVNSSTFVSFPFYGKTKVTEIEWFASSAREWAAKCDTDKSSQRSGALVLEAVIQRKPPCRAQQLVTHSQTIIWVLIPRGNGFLTCNRQSVPVLCQENGPTRTPSPNFKVD